MSLKTPSGWGFFQHIYSYSVNSSLRQLNLKGNVSFIMVKASAMRISTFCLSDTCPVFILAFHGQRLFLLLIDKAKAKSKTYM